MLKFTEEQSELYKKSQIQGTSAIVFEKLEMLIKEEVINMRKVLDLGCGYGRSTRFLMKYSRAVDGTDIDIKSIDYCKNILNKGHFFLNNKDRYLNEKEEKYTSIFSFFMLFHIENTKELKEELSKCFRDLKNNGLLILISGTKNLYSKNYVSVKGIKEPEKSGEKAEIFLKNIKSKITDIYWNEDHIAEQASLIGFVKKDIIYPKAQEVAKGYIDEYLYPPYFILILKKR